MDDTVLFHAAPILACVCYLAGTVVYYYYWLRKSADTLTAAALMALGFVFHLVFLFSYSLVSAWGVGGRVVLPRLPYSLSVISFLIVGGLLVHAVRDKGRSSLGIVASPVVSLLMLSSAYLFHWHRPEQFASSSGVLWLHVISTLLGDASFVFAFCASVIFLLEEHLLRAKKFSFVLGRLPSLAFLDRLNGSMVALGFSAMAAGVVSGIHYAVNNSIGMSELGPRLVWSYVIVAVYGLLVFARAAKNCRGRKAAYLSIAGFLIVVASFFGARSLGSGIHGF